MKFKKSYILMVSLISVFLLLSLSAVSAADIADNAGADLAASDIDEIGGIDNSINDYGLSQVDDSPISINDDPSGDGGDDNDETVVESINTTIEADDYNYTFGETIKINFTLRDNESNIIYNATESDFIIFYKNGSEENFNKTIGFSINDGSQFVIDQLAVGNYIIKIQFKNSTIDEKNYTGNETFINLNINKTDTRIECNDAKVKIGEDIIIPFYIYVESNNTLNVNASRMKVIFDGEEYDCTNITGGNNVTNGIKIIGFNKGIGQYDITIQYLGNNNCNSSSKTITLSILENNTIVIVDDVIADFETHNVTIPIVIDGNGTAVDFTKDNITLELVYYNGTDYETVNIDFNLTNKDGNYTISFINDTILFNDAKLTIIYANGTLNETTNTITFIEKNIIITDDTINVNNHTHNVTIPISVNHTTIISYDGKEISNSTVLSFTQENISLELVYNDGTDNVTIPINNYGFIDEDGNYTIWFVNDTIPLNDAKLTIVFANNTLDQTNKTVTLKEVIEANIVPITVSADYQDGQFVFLLNDTITGPLANTNVTVKWNCLIGSINFILQKTISSDENGLIKINNTDLYIYNNQFIQIPLSVGNYNLTFKGGNGLVLDNTTEITVNKVNVNILPNAFVTYAGDSKNFTVKVVNRNTGNVLKSVKLQLKVKINGKYSTYYITTDDNGIARISVTLAGGEYPIIVSTSDSNINSASANSTLVVNKKDAVLTASDRTILYGSGTCVIVTVKDKKTGNVLPNTYVLLQVYISAKKVNNYLVKTDSKGVARFSTGLTVGKHKVLMSVLDNYYKSSTLTRYVTVKKTTGKFTAPKVSTYYNSGKVFQIKLTNTANKALMYGSTMNIKVYLSKNKYYNLTGTTNANGVVQFKINYKPGTYKVVISAFDKGYTAKALTSQIKVSKSPIKMAPTALKVKKGKYFKVKVTSTKSKKVLSGIKVKVKVYTGKKFKTYTIKTNKNGIASLKISQKVGKHKIVLSPATTSLYSAKALTKTLTVTK